MLYPIPNELTDGDWEVGWNATLSDLDKALVRELYPKTDAGAAVSGLQVDGPVVQSSVVEMGSEPEFRFSVAASNDYVLETTGNQDTQLWLYDAQGKNVLVASDDDDGEGLNARIERKLKPGNYRVKVQLYNQIGGGEFGIAVKSA